MTARVCPIKGCYSPLMQEPGSDILTCGKCGFRCQYADEKAKTISFNIDPSDLARQIKENANKNLEEYYQNEDNTHNQSGDNISVVKSSICNEVATKIKYFTE